MMASKPTDIMCSVGKLCKKESDKDKTGVSGFEGDRGADGSDWF